MIKERLKKLKNELGILLSGLHEEGGQYVAPDGKRYKFSSEDGAIEEIVEPTVEEPTIEEPTVEEPTIEEPTIEEPTIEEPVDTEEIDKTEDNNIINELTDANASLTTERDTLLSTNETLQSTIAELQAKIAELQAIPVDTEKDTEVDKKVVIDTNSFKAANYFC